MSMSGHALVKRWLRRAVPEVRKRWAAFLQLNSLLPTFCSGRHCRVAANVESGADFSNMFLALCCRVGDDVSLKAFYCSCYFECL